MKENPGAFSAKEKETAVLSRDQGEKRPLRKKKKRRGELPICKRHEKGDC